MLSAQVGSLGDLESQTQVLPIDTHIDDPAHNILK